MLHGRGKCQLVKTLYAWEVWCQIFRLLDYIANVFNATKAQLQETQQHDQTSRQNCLALSLQQTLPNHRVLRFRNLWF